MFIVAAGLMQMTVAASRPSSAERWTLLIIWVVVCCGLSWRAWRTRSLVYIRLENDRLQVFVSGKPQHNIALSDIASWEPKFNRTVLRLHDGSEISLTHTLFRQGEDASAFRAALTERLGQINGVQIKSL